MLRHIGIALLTVFTLHSSSARAQADYPQEVVHFFTDRKPNEPFFPGMRPLDYSLQLADGVANFREWVRINFPDKVEDLYGDVVTPMSLNFEFMRRQFPASQESLARTLAEDSYSSPFARGENE